MTNPSPLTKSERAAHREAHDADSYFRRQVLEPEEQGRHAKSSAVVGAGAAYPKAAGPWADPVVAEMNSAPDTTGYDQTSAPDLGDAPPRRTLAQSDSVDLAQLTDRELLHRRRWAELAMKQTFEDTAKIDQCQAIIDAVDAEQRSRL
jgi:hypothetical protein